MEFVSHLNDPDVFNDPQGFRELNIQLFAKEKATDISSTASPGQLSPTLKAVVSDDVEIDVEDERESGASTKAISNIELFKLLLSKVAGKDRLSKVSQYALNLIKFHLINTRRFIINEKFENISPDPRQHWRDPLKYMKLLLFLNSTTLEKKIFEATKNISSFRYALRFGGTPLRIKSFIETLKSFTKSPSLLNFHLIFCNEQFLGDFIDLYYGIFDELELLFKINVLTNPTVKSFVVRQGVLAWYADILLGLKKNWVKLETNRERQLQIDIQRQVRKRASIMSKKIVESVGSTPLRHQLMREFANRSPVDTGVTLAQELKQLKREEAIAKLDLIRLSFDFMCDSIDVFNLNLPSNVYLTCGLISGICGLRKVWVMCRQELEDKC